MGDVGPRRVETGSREIGWPVGAIVVNDHMHEDRPQPKLALLKPTALAAQLGVSRSWLYEAAKTGGHSIGGEHGPLRLVPEEIWRWMTTHARSGFRGTRKAQAQRTQSSAVRRTVLGYVLRASPDKRPRRAGSGIRRRLQAAPGRPASTTSTSSWTPSLAPTTGSWTPSQTASGSIASTSSPVAGCGSS